MSRRHGGVGGLAKFALAAGLFFVLAVAILRAVWLERAASFGWGGSTMAAPWGLTHYFTAFVIALFAALAFSHFRAAARPLWLGFIIALLTGIYMWIATPSPTATDGLIVFIAYWIAGTVAAGLADGFVKGYSLRGA